MSFINYVSNIAIPFTILIIIVYGLIEKQPVFDIFLDGAKEGMQIVLNIFPTLLGLFLSINALRASGIIDGITNLILPILNFLKFPSEILPLALLRPISGSASMAIATDIMKNFGVDSFIGLICSTIMGATETTLYTIALYTSAIKVKKTRFVLVSAFLADFVRNINFCHFLENYVVIFFLTFLNIKHIIISQFKFIFRNQNVFIQNNIIFFRFYFYKEIYNQKTISKIKRILKYEITI